MKLSNKGLLEIAEHEGIVPAPYRDSVGVWTFGVGHTAAAGGLDPREMNGAMPTGAALESAVDRALTVFRSDIPKYEARVRKAFPVTLKQHQFDALVSWDFNTGGATWRSKRGSPAQLVQQVNRGDMSGDGFMGWLKPPEIRKRRTAEMRLFQTGDYDANGRAVPIWKTNGAGRLTGILRTMDGVELLARMGPLSKPIPAPTPAKPSQSPWAALLAALAGIIERFKR